MWRMTYPMYISIFKEKTYFISFGNEINLVFLLVTSSLWAHAIIISSTIRNWIEKWKVICLLKRHCNFIFVVCTLNGVPFHLCSLLILNWIREQTKQSFYRFDISFTLEWVYKTGTIKFFFHFPAQVNSIEEKISYYIIVKHDYSSWPKSVSEIHTKLENIYDLKQLVNLLLLIRSVEFYILILQAA